VTERPDLRALVGEDLEPGELERLERTQDLLLAAGPLPELPPSLAQPPVVERERDASAAFAFLPRRGGRILTLAAALAVMTLVIGYIVGSRHGGFNTEYTVRMHGTPAAARAAALIRVGHIDSVGNWPLEVQVTGLRTLPENSYYVLYLTKHKRPAVACGTFRVHQGQTVVRMNAPYRFKSYDGWVVVAHEPGATRPGPTLLTT
jgi:hypothetical protein